MSKSTISSSSCGGRSLPKGRTDNPMMLFHDCGEANGERNWPPGSELERGSLDMRGEKE